MNKIKFRRIVKNILITISSIIALLYLVSSLMPWISPQYFWILGFLGIGFPYLLIAMLLMLLFWLIAKKKMAAIVFVVLCVGYKQTGVLFAFNTNDTFKRTKSNYNIRVISWNIGNMSGKPQNTSQKAHSVDDIVGSLLKQNADILCLQEFEDCKNGCKSAELIKKKYPYYYFPGWMIGKNRHGSGNAIFSKYPIINADSTRFDNGENIINCDIDVNNDTISFFTTHLESFKFSKKEFLEIDDISKKETVPQKTFYGIVSKMKSTMQIHNKQATVVTNVMNKTKYPVVFCGDLNDVSTNSVYWTIRANKQDAFLKKGFGLGKTYNSLSTALRIDYIMPDSNFEITQFELIDEKMSDHKMLVSDIVLQKYQPEKSNK